MTDLGFLPLHGVHEPEVIRRAGRGPSRRTASIDMTRDEGSLDPVYLNGFARDLWTAADGTVTELGTATLSAPSNWSPASSVMSR